MTEIHAHEPSKDTPPSREVSLYKRFVSFLRVDLATMVVEAGDSPDAVRLAQLGASLGQFVRGLRETTAECNEIAQVSNFVPPAYPNNCARPAEITAVYKPRNF